MKKEEKKFLPKTQCESMLNGIEDALYVLIENGLIQRKVHADTHPVIVEYILTDYAMTLEDLLHMLSKWGEEHKERIKAQWRKSY